MDIPEWGVTRIRTKIDTGARTSSLHVDDVTLLKNNRIRFYIVLCKNDTLRRKKVIATRLRKGKVKSSTGVRTERWYVKTGIKIGDFHREIEINLVGREGMNFRMILGRTAIRNAFVVDVDRSFLISRKIAGTGHESCHTVART